MDLMGITGTLYEIDKGNRVLEYLESSFNQHLNQTSGGPRLYTMVFENIGIFHGYTTAKHRCFPGFYSLPRKSDTTPTGGCWLLPKRGAPTVADAMLGVELHLV